MDSVLDLVRELNGMAYYRNAELSRYSTIRIGGKADLVVFPRVKEDLPKLLFLIGKYDIPYTVVGQGSNVLFPDEGIRGVVICTRDIRFSRIRGDRLYVGCGAKLPQIVQNCAESGIGCLEFAAGIPASVGGAVKMNAGAYGKEIKDVLISCEIYRNGSIIKRRADEMEFGYRTGGIGADEVVLQAEFLIERKSKEEVTEKIAEYKAMRSRTQPTEPSLGSVFKRAAGVSAGYYIDKAGLKGMRIGDAMVSEIHAGFIVNKGKATAKDFCGLVEEIKERVFKCFGIMLEEEIIKVH